jgi:hypothetical protein
MLFAETMLGTSVALLLDQPKPDRLRGRELKLNAATLE